MGNGAGRAHTGRLTMGFVDLGEGPRRVTVYLPAGWPRTRPRAALYFLHGAGYDDTSLLGQVGMETRLKRDLDDAVTAGDAPPLMVVCPHYSDATTAEGATAAVAKASEALRRLVRYAEPTFLCRTDRYRRAVAGFSMGGAIAWEALVAASDLFSVFYPIGSDCWSLGYEGGRSDPTGTARTIADAANPRGETCAVKAWCGERDPSAPWVEKQVDEMNRLGFGPGSAAFSTIPGVGHEASSVRPAILDCLHELGDARR